MLKTCPECHSQNTKQLSSVLARILISVYLFMLFLFFSGSMDLISVILAFLPIVIPYHNKCVHCNHSYFTLLPQWGMTSLIGNNINLIKYLFGILPSMLTITILIYLLPFTGLGRIISIPLILIINSTVIFVGIRRSRNLKFVTRSLVWMLVFLLTVFVSICLFPQEDGSSVLQHILKKINE